MRIATKFRLLLLSDIASFLFVCACLLSLRPAAKVAGVLFLIVADRAGAYAQRLIGGLTLRQMRIRAIVTVVRYLAFSGFFIWADFTIFQNPPGKAPPGILSLLVIPILMVFCYVQVHNQLRAPATSQ